MISDYLKKYSQFYLSKYSVTKKKFENILKKKINNDFLKKKIDEQQQQQFLNQVEQTVKFFEKLSVFNEKQMIDLRIDNFVKKGFSLKKIYLELQKDLFNEELLKEKINELKSNYNFDEEQIKIYLKKRGLLKKVKTHENNYDENSRKLFQRLLSRGFSYENAKKYLKKNAKSD